MDTSIAVAIIASVAAVLTPLLSWLGTRQATADARANINRDLDILIRLNPQSQAAKTLEADIGDAIEHMVRKQKWRRSLRITFGPIVPAYLLITIGIVGLIVTDPDRSVYGRQTFWNVVQLFGVLYLIGWLIWLWWSRRRESA